jgi:methylmalonyl-CoA epimerase
MRAVLDHVGIAVKDLGAALAFYRDALGLEIEPPEEVASQRVRAHFIAVGDVKHEGRRGEGAPGVKDQGAGAPGVKDQGAGAPGVKLELLEATEPDSPIAKYVEKRGPGLHHITLRVDDIHAAVAQLKSRGVRMIDETPRPGAEGSTIAFVHPAAAHGVLIELKQSHTPQPPILNPQSSTLNSDSESVVRRFALGNFELLSVSDGFIRLDGGAMFGVVPKPLWSKVAPADDRNRITLAMRPLIVRGARTMLIDAGLGDKDGEKFHEIYGVDRRRNLDHALAEAGVAPEDIDIVLASHLHFDHAGGFTVRAASGRLKPRFPRAQYIVRRGEWDDATHPNERNRASYLADNFAPLAEAGVLQLVDDDRTIMPGVRVRRTGGHTMHHQMVEIESGGKAAAFVADMMPTIAHLPHPWIMGYDLHPLDTLSAKQRFIKDAIERDILVFFEHDPHVAAGYIREEGGKRTVQPATT